MDISEVIETVEVFKGNVHVWPKDQVVEGKTGRILSIRAEFGNYQVLVRVEVSSRRRIFEWVYVFDLSRRIVSDQLVACTFRTRRESLILLKDPGSVGVSELVEACKKQLREIQLRINEDDPVVTQILRELRLDAETHFNTAPPLVDGHFEGGKRR